MTAPRKTLEKEFSTRSATINTATSDVKLAAKPATGSQHLTISNIDIFLHDYDASGSLGLYESVHGDLTIDRDDNSVRIQIEEGSGRPPNPLSTTFLANEFASRCASVDMLAGDAQAKDIPAQGGSISISFNDKYTTIHECSNIGSMQFSQQGGGRIHTQPDTNSVFVDLYSFDNASLFSGNKARLAVRHGAKKTDDHLLHTTLKPKG